MRFSSDMEWTPRVTFGSHLTSVGQFLPLGAGIDSVSEADVPELWESWAGCEFQSE